MDVGLLAAFIGGTLALLSPCGALLLPAFFASNVGPTPRLLLHGAAFYLGLVITLVPLGLGLGALGELTVTHRDVMIGGVALLLVALGLAQALGFGFDLSSLVPGRRTSRTGLIRTVLLGATGGVAGFCTGPILGAVLTLAMTRSNAGSAGVLLAVYGAGMVVPLMILAAGWDRIGDRTRRMLRGRGFTILGRQLHTTSVVSGVLMIVLGIAFQATNGLVDAPELVSADTQAKLQEQFGRLSGPTVDIAAILAATAVALIGWWLWQRRSDQRSQRPDQPDQPGGRASAAALGELERRS